MHRKKVKLKINCVYSFLYFTHRRFLFIFSFLLFFSFFVCVPHTLSSCHFLFFKSFSLFSHHFFLCPFLLFHNLYLLLILLLFLLFFSPIRGLSVILMSVFPVSFPNSFFIYIYYFLSCLFIFLYYLSQIGRAHV